MNVPQLVHGVAAATHEVAPAVRVADEVAKPLRAALFYTKGQSLGGARADEQIILTSLRNAGLDAELVDLSHVSQALDGTFLLRDPASGLMQPWKNPQAALMYHGAIAPANAVSMLGALDHSGTRVVNGLEPWGLLTDKFRFAQWGEQNGIRVIPTKLAETPEQLRAALAELPDGAIVKKPISTEGDEINVVRSLADQERIASRLDELGGRVIVQPMVDSRIGSDLESPIMSKVIESMRQQHTGPETGSELTSKLMNDLMGRRHEFRINSSRLPDGSVNIDAIYARVAPNEHQVVNNIAQGANGVKVNFGDLDPRDQAAVMRAIEKMPKDGDIVGWDLIGQPGQRYIIEGNSGSGIANTNEGYNPHDAVRSYGTIVRAAAESSPLAHV